MDWESRFCRNLAIRIQTVEVSVLEFLLAAATWCLTALRGVHGCEHCRVSVHCEWLFILERNLKKMEKFTPHDSCEPTTHVCASCEASTNDHTLS